jgi:DNA-binding response OmpR family regulator
MPERILVVEDDSLVRNLVVLNLLDAGHEVHAAGTFVEGDAKLAEGGWSLAVLDLMLPGGDGFELVQRARSRGQAFPLLMLTARGEVHAKVRALDAGADDYLPKPFDVEELLARVRALLRRSGASVSPPAQVLTIGAYQVRMDSGEALTREGSVVLTDKELRVLTLFARLENQPLSRADILEEAWGMDAFPTDRTVDNFILRLRKLFEPDPEHPVHFVTLRGRGYLFRRAPAPQPQGSPP